MTSRHLCKGLAAFLVSGSVAAFGCESETFVVGEFRSPETGSAGASVALTGPECRQVETECSSDQDCCSGLCDEGECGDLGGSCAPLGESCEDAEDCCSALCVDGRCDAGSSFCAQEDDVCARAEDCCSRTCDFSAGGMLGLCASVPSGPSNCRGVAGSLCDDCNDCCSRVCTEFGESGVGVCLKAGGCAQVGELCSTDLDCCGGDPEAQLPGAGNVTCERTEGIPWGICRNAMSCSPEGATCHIQDYSCSVSSAANKCCGLDGEDGECILDKDGVPRCSGLGSTCVEIGGDCAYDENCCEGTCGRRAGGGFHCEAEE